MRTLYVFSGLGADKRAFERIDFTGFSVTHIEWIAPLRNETLAAYALRISTQITNERPVLIGLSFGGIVAIEVAKIIHPERLILIASVTNRKEVPFYYRLAGKLRLHRMLPTALMKQSNFFSNWLFGISSTEDKHLLKAILKDTDPAFLRWAIDKVVHWDNIGAISNTTHIHGTTDRVLPYRFVNPDITIPGGGHFMTVNKADGLTTVLHKALSS